MVNPPVLLITCTLAQGIVCACVCVRVYVYVCVSCNDKTLQYSMELDRCWHMGTVGSLANQSIQVMAVQHVNVITFVFNSCMLQEGGKTGNVTLPVSHQPPSSRHV